MRLAKKSTNASSTSTIESRDSVTERLRRVSTRCGCSTPLISSPLVRPSWIASPTRVIEPVTTTARRGCLRAHSRACSHRVLERVVLVRRVLVRLVQHDRGELVDADRPIGRRPRHVEALGDRRELGDDAVRVLVGEHAEHERPLVEVEVLGERVAQGGGAVRVVRGIHEHRRLDADQLQPTRAR